MRAISLWQPWASLVVLGAKKIETRHWSTNYRGPLLIHAAKRTSELYLARSRNFAKALEPLSKPRKVIDQQAFAKSFLDQAEHSEKITRRMVILLSHEYQIDWRDCCLRIEELQLAKTKNILQWFDGNGGITEKDVRTVLGAGTIPSENRLPLGALLGIVNMIDCRPSESFTDEELNTERNGVVGWTENHFGNFAEGRFGWVFENPIMFPEALPYKGQQGFFEVPFVHYHPMPSREAG